MRAHLTAATAAGAVVTSLVAVPLSAPVAAAPHDKAIALALLGTHATGTFGQSAAEITAHDPLTQRLFVVNAQAGQVDVLDVSNPAAPVKVTSLAASGLVDASGTVIGPGASINSVDVRSGVLAVAVQAPVKTDLGWVAVYRTADLSSIGAGRVGAQPDMVVFADDDTVLVANEAEPDQAFASDPEGSVSLLDVPTMAVRTARFTAFEGAALPAGVRVFGPDVAVPLGQPTAGRVARNLEPESIAVDQQGKTAYVTLQEANTIAVVDIATAAVTDLWPLPLKDWSIGGNVLDVSDRDGRRHLQNRPVRGLLMPDAIAAYQVRGETFLVTANEGDAREWGTYEEPLRVGSNAVPLCSATFGNAATISALKSSSAMGRLNISRESPYDTTNNCYSQLHAFGGRSFSIVDGSGAVVFDSAAMIEGRIADLIGANELDARAFNANHEASPSFDTRSDDKGPEPEGVAIGKVGGRTYAFIALERVGGVMTFDITNPHAVVFVDYVNNRNFAATYVISNGQVTSGDATTAGDLGAEGIEFIAAEDSPSGLPLVAVANEVSGTTTLFQVESLLLR